jgi:uncharacterized protein (DUF1810 family)
MIRGRDRGTMAGMTVPHDLERFVTAQAGAYEGALGELRRGHKTGHWMWFIFPQLRGLGRSELSTYYGIASIHEARAYLAHPVLGPRLLACVAAVAGLADTTAATVFGEVDAAKLRSSMTLFASADPSEAMFGQLLDQWYGGIPDPLTLDRLGLAGGQLR